MNASEYTATGAPAISVGEIRYGKIEVTDSTRRVPETVTNRLPEYVLREGDLVFARKGAVDRSARVGAGQGEYFLGSDGIRLRFDSRVDSRFVALQLQLPVVRTWLLQHAAGSTMASLNEGIIQRIPIDVPELPVQLAIAEVLGALDDKIAANRQATASAASLASAIFDGARRVDAYETAIAEVSSMVTRGITPRYTESHGFVVLNQKCVRGQRVSLEPSRLTEPERARAEKRLRRDDVLVNSTGQGTLGRVARWTRPEDATVDSHISIVRFDPDKVDPVVAGFGVLVQESLIEGLAEGSTGQTELSRGQLSAVPLRLPPRSTHSALGVRLTELDVVQLAAETENECLAVIRDTLLPQLMSGKLRVKDAEQRVEAVV